MPTQKKGNVTRLRKLVERVIESNGVENSSPEILDIMELIEELHSSRQELKQQTQALQENQHRLEQSHRLYFRLFNLAPLAIMRMDKGLILTDANKAALDLLGPRRHLLGSSLEAFVERSSLSEFHRLVNEVAYEGLQTNRELTFNISVGMRSPFQVYLAALFDESEEPEGYLMALVDLSVQKQEQAERQKTAAKLEETNIALKVLLEKQEEKFDEFKDSVTANKVRTLDPLLQRMSKSGLNREQKDILDALQQNLNQLTIDFANKLSSPAYGLSPREVEVAALIRSGRTSDEIADILHLSLSGVLYHRNNIRKKLGILGNKERLAIILQKLS